MADNIYLDSRLTENAVRDGRLARKDLEVYLSGLKDSAHNIVEYDEEGNPTNIPERELKTLPIKPGEPETKVAAAVAPRDPLADAWDDQPGH